MAYNYFAEEEKDKDKTGDTGGMIEKPLGQEAGVITGNATPPAEGAPPANSGSFTNLQNYLDVNQSLNQGGRVAGRAQVSVDDARAKQSAADTEFRQKVDSNTVIGDSGMLSQVRTDPTKFFKPQPQPQPATARPANPANDISIDNTLFKPPKMVPMPFPGESTPPPVSDRVSIDNTLLKPRPATPPPSPISSTPLSIDPTRGYIPNENVGAYTPPNASALSKTGSYQPLDTTQTTPEYENFVKMRDAKYGGPKNLSDEAELYNPAIAQNEMARQSAALTETEGGRKTLLDNFYGAGAGRYNYTAGQKKLDDLLISQDDTSKAAFQKVRDDNSAVQGNFETLKGALGDYAKKGEDTTKKTRGDTREVLGIDDAGNVQDSSDIKTTHKAVQDRLSKELMDKQAEIGDLTQRLKGGNISAAQAKKLGISDMQTFNIDASNAKYLTAGADPNINQMATQEEQAKIAALSKLAGVDNTWLPSTEVGGYDPNSRFSYNAGLLKSDAGMAGNELQRQIDNYMLDSGNYVANVGPGEGYAASSQADGRGGYSMPIEKLMQKVGAAYNQSSAASKRPGNRDAERDAKNAATMMARYNDLENLENQKRQAGGSKNRLSVTST